MEGGKKNNNFNFKLKFNKLNMLKIEGQMASEPYE